jgi:hypothetical protein
MFVRLFLMRRYGRRLPQLEVLNSRPLVGTLVTFRIAQRPSGAEAFVLALDSLEDKTGKGTMAQLYEPTMTGIAMNVITFRGFERVDCADGQTSYAQEWRCELNSTPAPCARAPEAGQRDYTG